MSLNKSEHEIAVAGLFRRYGLGMVDPREREQLVTLLMELAAVTGEL